MSGSVDGLLSDLLAWLEPGGRPYAEVMEAWRTSCPRLPVWEEATERGLVELAGPGGGMTVRLTGAGRAFLAAARS